MVREPARVFRQRHKRALCHVLRQMRVADHAQGGGINEVNVPPHKFGKRGVRPARGVVAQKLLVGRTVHSLNGNRRRLNRTRKVKESFLRGDDFTGTPGAIDQKCGSDQAIKENSGHQGKILNCKCRRILITAAAGVS